MKIENYKHSQTKMKMVNFASSLVN